MTLGIVLAVVAAAGFAATAVWLLREDRADAGRVLGLPGSPLLSFTGTLQSPELNVSRLPVRLEFLEWGIRFSAGSLSARVVPVWEARYGEVTRAQLTESFTGQLGLRLSVDFSEDALVFWSTASDAAAGELAAREVPAGRDVAALADLTGGYRKLLPRRQSFVWAVLAPWDARLAGSKYARGWWRASFVLARLTWTALWLGFLWHLGPPAPSRWILLAIAAAAVFAVLRRRR